MESTEITRPNKTHFLNIPIDTVSLEEMDGLAKRLLSDGKVHQIVFISTFDLLRARRNGEYEQCLRKASLVVPTSKGIIRGAKFVNGQNFVRHMPFEFIIRLLGALEKQNRSLYLIGQNQAQIMGIENNLRVSFPNLKIVGRYQGFFMKEMESNIITAIKKASPSLLLAGRGLKGKDMWLFYNRKLFNPGIVVWSGECFDIFAGKKERISKAAWESGSYRVGELLRRPWHLFRVFVYLYFGILLLIHKIKERN